MLLCGICKETFSTNESLRVHLEGHATQLFDSDEEQEENEVINERDSDQDSDEGSLILDCVKEEEKLQSQQVEIQREDDLEKSTPALAESSEIFRCSKCSYKTISKKHFKAHMNVMHLNKYKCDHCPKRYPSKGYLANHIDKEHGEDEKHKMMPEDEFFRVIWKKQNKIERKYFECLECTFQVSDKRNIYCHIRGVHRKLLDELYKSKGMVNDDAGYHKCTECFFKTLHKRCLRTHIQAIHQKRRDYICDLCKKTFPIKIALDHHMKSIHMSDDSSKLYKCSICSFRSKFNWQLRAHMNRVHLKIRKLTCDLCQKQFAAKSNLRKHIGVHMEKICKFNVRCCFRATNQHELERHIRRVHQKMQGFSCEFCGKWYSTPSGLRFHKKTHHASDRLL